MEVSRAVAAIDHAVSCDKAFISKTDMGKGGGGGGGPPGLAPSGPMAGMRVGGGAGESSKGGGGGASSRAPGEGLPMASPVVGELLDNLDETMS